MAKLWNKIYIHPTTYFLLLFSLLFGLFKYILIISLIVIVHECGHILIALIFKRKISSINFFPFGGLVKFDTYLSTDIFEDLLIASGGIFFQIILGFIFIILKKNELVSLDFYELFINYNVMLIIFNLTPIIPLDGARIAKLLTELVVPFRISFLIIYLVSLMMLIFFSLVHLDLLRENFFVYSFLIFSNIQELKSSKYLFNRFLLERYNHKFTFPKRSYISKTSNMYKNRENIICGLDEQKYLKLYHFR